LGYTTSDEGHHFVDPVHQRDVLQRALGWFEKYLPASK
jgi:dipeptidyl aminopeptidase/acylaminoacyl peptidase